MATTAITTQSAVDTITSATSRKLRSLPRGYNPPALGGVVQLVRTPACHAGGRGFESRRSRLAHRTLKRQVSAVVLCTWSLLSERYGPRRRGRNRRGSGGPRSRAGSGHVRTRRARPRG